MKKMINYKTNYGRIRFNLKKVLDRREMSIYELSKRTGVKYDVIKNYYNASNYAYNFDTLARICYILDCDITDLMEYDIDYIPINRN